MVEYKPQKKKTFLQKLKKWKNLSYVLMGLAVLVMICIAAVSYQRRVHSELQDRKYKSMNQEKGVLFGCPSLERGILLTFDDGPTTETPKTLQFLKDRNITALFFLSTENVRRHPGTAKTISQDGHKLGIYIDGSSKLLQDFQENVIIAEKTLMNETGVAPQFLRPSNQTISKENLKVATSLGYTVVMWSSAVKELEEKQTFQYLVKSLPSQGAILTLPESFNWLFNHIDKISERFLSPKECFIF